MKAIIIAPNGYRCAPNGSTVVSYEIGTEVDGKVAEWAVADGAAEPMNSAPVDADGNGYATVAEIKAALDDRGITYPKKAKRDDLLALLPAEG